MEGGGPILGIVAPHPPVMVKAVGGSRSRVTDASIRAISHAATVLQRFSPDTLVVMSPHAPGHSDALTVDTSDRLTGTLARFGAAGAGVSAPGDSELAEAVLNTLESAGIPASARSRRAGLGAGELDHGVIVPLSFLDPVGRWPLVVISLSALSLETHRRAGAAIASAASALRRRIAFVASGDLSHRLTPDAPAGYVPRAAEFDEAVVEAFRISSLDELMALDPGLIEAAGECGLRSFVTLSGVMPGARSELLAYEAPWGVGYLTALVAPDGLAEELDIARPTRTGDTPPQGRKGGTAAGGEHPIVALARSTIEAHLAGASVPAPHLPDEPELPPRAGAFVTLHRNGSLRGCIGTILPTRPTLAEEVITNAVKAATEDPRFPPLTADELDDLDIKVDVLHAPEPAVLADLDPATFGVIVSRGWRRGLLLPDLEGVDTAQQQVDIACRKGGIGPDECVELERFRVERYI